MMNLEQLREYLTESKADCEIIEHENQILKTKDAAEYFDLEPVSYTHLGVSSESEDSWAASASSLISVPSTGINSLA